MIVSNNHDYRVKPFADMLGLEFVSEGRKPLSKGINEAQTNGYTFFTACCCG